MDPKTNLNIDINSEATKARVEIIDTFKRDVLDKAVNDFYKFLAKFMTDHIDKPLSKSDIKTIKDTWDEFMNPVQDKWVIYNKQN